MRIESCRELYIVEMKFIYLHGIDRRCSLELRQLPTHRTIGLIIVRTYIKALIIVINNYTYII